MFEVGIDIENMESVFAWVKWWEGHEIKDDEETDEREGEDFVSRNKNKPENPFFPIYCI